MQRLRDQLLALHLIVNQGLLIGAGPDVHPSVFIACPLYPEGCIAVGGLAQRIGCGVTGDIDGNELVFLVLIIPLSDFIGGLTVSDTPVPTITGPDRRYSRYLTIGVGTEPHGTVTGFAESLRGRKELVHWHCLAEGEPFRENALRRLDPAHKGGVGFGPRGDERRIIPGVGRFLGELRSENSQYLLSLFSATGKRL